MNKKFIVFEGIDRSGKTTQAKLLYQRLKDEGEKVILTNEPGETAAGNEIRKLLLESELDLLPLTEVFLFEADRREHVEKVIIPHLEKGYFVISDRYTYSTIAYQGGGKGIDEKIIEELNSIATDKLFPDIVFLIDISPETALKRKGKTDRMEKGGIQFLKKVREKYLELARKNSNFSVIDGEKTIEEINSIIWEIVWKS